MKTKKKVGFQIVYCLSVFVFFDRSRNYTFAANGHKIFEAFAYVRRRSERLRSRRFDAFDESRETSGRFGCRQSFDRIRSQRQRFGVRTSGFPHSIALRGFERKSQNGQLFDSTGGNGQFLRIKKKEINNFTK